MRDFNFILCNYVWVCYLTAATSHQGTECWTICHIYVDQTAGHHSSEVEICESFFVCDLCVSVLVLIQDRMRKSKELSGRWSAPDNSCSMFDMMMNVLHIMTWWWMSCTCIHLPSSACTVHFRQLFKSVYNSDLDRWPMCYMWAEGKGRGPNGSSNPFESLWTCCRWNSLLNIGE